MTVSATETMSIVDWAGAIGGGDDVGVGAALDVNIVTEDDQAYIAPNATVDAAQNVDGHREHERHLPLDHGGGRDGRLGRRSPARPRSRSFRRRRTRTSTSGTTVDAQGDVLVQASRQATINTLAGQLGISGDASVGAAVSTVVDTVNTDAYIAANDAITAQGTSGTIPVLDRQFPGRHDAVFGRGRRRGDVSERADDRGGRLDRGFGRRRPARSRSTSSTTRRWPISAAGRPSPRPTARRGPVPA